MNIRLVHVPKCKFYERLLKETHGDKAVIEFMAALIAYETRHKLHIE